MTTKQIGELVKAKRQEMSLTLKEVENATSIRVNYLKAIEEGQGKDVISAVYAEGFVRQYASFLGVDVQPLLEKDLQVEQKPSKQEFSYGIGTLEVRGNPGASVKWFPNLAWVFATLLVFIAAWFFAKFLEVI